MKAAPFVFAALALAACSDGFERMELQRKGVPYRNEMRAPPEGTIPREREQGDPAFITGKAGGVYVTHIPKKVDRALLDRGRERFEVVCATCHGDLGDGNSLVAPKMLLRRPPSLVPHRDHSDGEIFQIITDGYGLMPPFGRTIDTSDRWAIVAYFRALTLSQHARIDQAEDSARARLEAETP